MNDLVRVSVSNGLTDGFKHGEQAARIVLMPQDFIQCVSFNQFHGQERPSIRQGADLVNGRNAWVLQLAGNARLIQESLSRRRVRRKTSGKNLDSDIAVKHNVSGTIDYPHSTTTYLVEQFITRGVGKDGGGSIAGRSGRYQGICHVLVHDHLVTGKRN
jgi:hypothetical protein